MSSENGIRIHVDLPNHPAIAGETLWADPVGDDVYRLANVPFWAYGLNHGDLVRATPDSNGILTIREVVEPGGHRTLRIMFGADIDRGRQEDLLGRICEVAGVTFERADDRLVASRAARARFRARGPRGLRRRVGCREGRLRVGGLAAEFDSHVGVPRALPTRSHR